MLVKELFGSSKEVNIKACIMTRNGNTWSGTSDYYSAKELSKWYGNCKCVNETYEDDDGGYIRLVNSLNIYAKKNYYKKIMKKRK